MPIVVSYDDVEALGSAALSGGYSEGYGGSYAQSRESALNRQSNDTRFLLNNVFQQQSQDRAIQAQQDADAQRMRFQAQQADLSRGYESQQGNVERDFRQQMADKELSARIAQENAQFNQKRTLAEEDDARARQNAEYARAGATQDRRTLREEERAYQDQTRSENNNRSRNEFVQAYQSQMNPETGRPYSQGDAVLAYDRMVAERTLREGNWAPRTSQGGGGSSGSPFGTLSGQMAQDAYLAAQRGDFQSIASALEDARYGERGAAMLQAENGINLAVDEAVQRAVNGDSSSFTSMLQTAPPQIRQRLQQVAAQQGLFQYGSNQIGGRGTPGGAGDQLSPAEQQELEALRQRYRGR